MRPVLRLRMHSRVHALARRAKPHVELFCLICFIYAVLYLLLCSGLPLLLSAALLALAPFMAAMAYCLCMYARIRYMIAAARVGDIVTVWSPFSAVRPLALMALGPSRRPRPWGFEFGFGRYATWRWKHGPGHALPSRSCLEPLEGLRVREPECGVPVAELCMRSGCVTMFSTRSALVRTSWADVCDVLRRADPGAGYSMRAGEHLMLQALRGRLDAAARTVQRAWRRRALDRKRAVLVIEDAALHAMYRPGGWRLGAVLDHWRRLAVQDGTPRPPTGPDMV